jgi:ferredoxin-nitrite reductase
MRTKDKKMVEAFEIYVGGTLNEGGKFNEKLKGKFETNQLDEVLFNLISYFKETKLPSETFFDYVNRTGLEQLQIQLDEISGRLTEQVS